MDSAIFVVLVRRLCGSTDVKTRLFGRRELQRKSRVLLPTLIHIAVDRFHCVRSGGGSLPVVAA